MKVGIAVHRNKIFIITLLAPLVLASCGEPQRRPANQLPPAAVGLKPASSAPAAGNDQIAATAEIARPGQPPSVAQRQLFPGTGRVIGAAGSPSRYSDGVAEGDITLNFLNADIKDVARAVLGEILRVNYTIDPKAQGNITLQTSRPITREAVLPVLESALRLNGLGIVRAGDVYTVVQTTDALRYGPGIGRSGIAMSELPGYGLRVVPLSFISAEEMASLLRSFMPQDAVIRTTSSRNVLLLGGSQGEITTMLETIGVFDVNWMAGMSFGLFTPRNVDAKTVAKELEVIFGLTVKQSGAGAIRIVPIERINAVLAIAASAGSLREIESWVDRLDKGAENVDTRIFVYYVQNGRATDLAAVLTNLFGEGGEATSGRQGSRRTESDPGRSISVGTGNVQAAALDRNAPPPSASGGAGLADMGLSDPGIKLSGGGMRLKADEVNNALLILATPREYRVIEAALAKLDIPPLQVMIEAVVAEVTLTDELKYGVQWLFQPGAQSFTLSQASTGAVAGSFPGFSAVLRQGADIRAVLNMLSSVTTVNVVSSPKLMVMNNQTATLQVGDQVPISTQSAVSTSSAGAPVVSTIQYRDTGVILKVTPRVNEGGLVAMDITQEVSDVTSTTTSKLDSPTIQQRKVSSSVSVTTGETIAMGGLIRDRRTNGSSGIPLLKDVPLMGNLFKSTTEATTRTELLVLITPQVVRSPTDIRRVTQELRERLRIPAELLGDQ